eukprot:jgi/Undpi1/9324/HiC_scaffold_26.g11782.m1
MGRWAALAVASASLPGCHAFLLPCASSSSRCSSSPATAARALTAQPVPRCRMPSVSSWSATRTSRTRVCAAPLETFSSQADYDRFLGELIFSQSDVRDDVLKSLDKAGDEGFMKWLEQKIQDCDDLDERVGLKSLMDIIKQVKDFVDKAIAEEEKEREAAEAAEAAGANAVDAEVVGETGVGVGVGVGGVGGGVVGDGVVGDGVVAVVGGGGEGAGANAVDVEVVGQTGKAFQLLGNPIRWISVWEEMRRLQRLGTEAVEAEGVGDAVEALKQAQISPFEGLPDKASQTYPRLIPRSLSQKTRVRAGYEELLGKLLNRAEGESLDDAVEINYDQCDIQFLTLLNQKAQEAAGTDGAKVLTELGLSINNVMKRRMEKASERLQAILTAGNPARMEETIAAMAERGEVDDALVLLLQANLEQAESAGAKPAAEVLKKLVQAAQAAQDEKADPEKRLLRQLLRAGEREDRLAILNKAFRQRAKVVLADGSETSDAPDVTPPKFIEVVKSVIRNFGNVGEAEVGFADKLDDIISEAEQVATELYGETQTPQDQQDRAWKDTTVSVFDLENLEEQGKMQGEEMPWANDMYDGMTPEMVKNFKVNEDGNIQIGGS